MTKLELFNSQKEELKDAIAKTLYYDSELYDAFRKSVLSKIKGSKSLAEEVIENEYLNANKKMKWKFNDLIDKYTISNGNESVDASEEMFNSIVFSAMNMPYEAILELPIVMGFISIHNAEWDFQETSKNGLREVGFEVKSGWTKSMLNTFGFDLEAIEENGSGNGTIVIHLA